METDCVRQVSLELRHGASIDAWIVGAEGNDARSPRKLVEPLRHHRLRRGPLGAGGPDGYTGETADESAAAPASFHQPRLDEFSISLRYRDLIDLQLCRQHADGWQTHPGSQRAAVYCSAHLIAYLYE